MAHFNSLHVQALWRQTKPSVWPGTYWMAAFKPEDWHEAATILRDVPPRECYASAIRDRHEVAVILPTPVWDAHKGKNVHRQAFGPLIAITFDVPLDIAVAGYLSPVIGALADAGVSVVPQCALVYDHVLVHERDAGRAIAVIEALQSQAAEE